jgi:hypothetical protein
MNPRATITASSVKDGLPRPVREPVFFLGLFTVESWREFKRHGGQVMGFNEKKSKTVARLQPGDRILCYLSKVSAFVGVMEVAEPSYLDHTPIWSDGVFPVRLPVRIVTELPMVLAVPIHSLKGQLSFLPLTMNSTGWTIYVRSSPRRWTKLDGEAVTKALAARVTLAQDSVAELSHVDTTPIKSRKRIKLPLTARVGRLIQRTDQLASAEPPGSLGSYDNVLSGNKVTGYSVNVPIAETCLPTAICMKTCYFAIGAPSWANSLRHQRKVHASMQCDPLAFAERVAMEYDSLGLTFIRWNGGGDLFEESVTTVNYLAKMRPDIVIWVVTRVPKWAALIEQAPRVFVHFSLDKHSRARRDVFLKHKPRTSNYFFSYQCDDGEVPPLENLENVAVLFFDNYKPTTDLAQYRADVVCPLNTASDITGVCERCRRCFNGDAVSSLVRS